MGESLRENVFHYLRNKYKSEIEYLRLSAPNYGIARNKNNNSSGLFVL